MTLTKEQQDKVDKRLKEIKVKMDRALIHQIGKTVSAEVIHEVVTVTMLQIIGIREEWLKFDVVKEGDYEVSLVPGNLYTSILLASPGGINHTLIDEEAEIALLGHGPYTAPDGTVFELKAGSLMMKAPAPVNYIDVTFTVGGDNADNQTK